jgi:hypothetical protein
VLLPLLGDNDRRVLESALGNPRLRESDVLQILRRPDVKPLLLEAAASSPRWMDSYAVRLALVLAPRTPLGVALAQVSSLTKKDLLRVAGTRGLRPLIQAAAQRVAADRPSDGEAGPRKTPPKRP